MGRESAKGERTRFVKWCGEIRRGSLLNSTSAVRAGGGRALARPDEQLRMGIWPADRISPRAAETQDLGFDQAGGQTRLGVGEVDVTTAAVE
jgi:hypothetical protein